MKRFTTRTNSTCKRLSLFAGGLAALTLATCLVPAATEAAVRVSARVRHPNVQANIELGPRYNHFGFVRAERHRLTKVDRKIARRLARLTGERKGLILHLRRDGYRWRQIGAMLCIPPRVLRAAMAPCGRKLQTWNNRHKERRTTHGLVRNGGYYGDDYDD